MSKRSKAAAKEKRAKEKRARKASMKAQYEAWRDAGITKHSRRAKAQDKAGVSKLKRNSGKKKIPWPVHLWVDKAGNLLPGSPHQVYLAWREQQAA